MTINEVTAQAAARWWADRLRQGDKEKFIERLGVLILADLERHGRCSLHCDYDPEDHLLDAVRYAGVECRGFMFSVDGILPRKHTTLIEPGRIKPKEGYARWTEPIVIGEPDK